MRFCAGMREISKQSQVSPKARHTRCLLLLKKSCCKELLRFYPGKISGTAAVRALPPPHAQGHWQCNRCCATKEKDYIEKLSPNFFGRAVRFCACMREISKQSQVSSKARYTRCLLLLKKSCRKELLHFYPGKMPGTAAMRVPPPPHAQGHRRCNRRCAAASRRLAKSSAAAMCAPPPRHARGHWRCSCHCAIASQSLAKRPVLQPCVHRCHITPGDIGAAAAAVPLRLDSWQNPGAAAMCVPPTGHAQGHQAAAS